MHFLSRMILWTYPRGSWQYDLLALTILAFIFFMPKEVFSDQPHLETVREVQILSEASAHELFWIESFVARGISDNELHEEMETLLWRRTGRTLTVIDIQPLTSNKDKTHAYLVHARP